MQEILIYLTTLAYTSASSTGTKSKHYVDIGNPLFQGHVYNVFWKKGQHIISLHNTKLRMYNVLMATIKNHFKDRRMLP